MSVSNPGHRERHPDQDLSREPAHRRQRLHAGRELMPAADGVGDLVEDLGDVAAHPALDVGVRTTSSKLSDRSRCDISSSACSTGTPSRTCCCARRNSVCAGSPASSTIESSAWAKERPARSALAQTEISSGSSASNCRWRRTARNRRRGDRSGQAAGEADDACQKAEEGGCGESAGRGAGGGREGDVARRPHDPAWPHRRSRRFHAQRSPSRASSASDSSSMKSEPARGAPAPPSAVYSREARRGAGARARRMRRSRRTRPIPTAPTPSTITSTPP